MTDEVARYYDANTKRFLARGQGSSASVIHRAVWGEGVGTRREAFHYVHELILRELREIEGDRVLDLGCGIGASLAYITATSGARGFGITNSALQAELAPPGLEVMLGNFETDALPGPVDLAYAIESFVHAYEPRRFFGNVAPALREGGRLVICDDFASGRERDDPWVRRFMEGWHASSLVTPEEADASASEHGLEPRLERERDLTSHLEIDRPRDRWIRLVVALGRRLGARGPRFEALSGGDALRQCLKRGLATYRFRVYEKV